MIDEEDLVEMYAAFEEGLHWDGEWTANLLIEYRELSTEVKRLNKFEKFVQWLDEIHHEGGDIGKCWETEVLKVLGEEE